MKIAVLPVTPFQQNCAILWDEATMRGAVIDPGGEVGRIVAEVERLGVAVERIALTHGHFDHAGGAAELKQRLGGVPVEGPDERDRFLLDALGEDGPARGLAEARAVTPDRWLREGDAVELGGVAFDVLHCPGHTPGHVVFTNPGGRFALVGDTLFRGSVGRTDLPYGSQNDLIASIRTKLLPLGDDVRFLCGHGPGSTIGVERATNPFLHG